MHSGSFCVGFLCAGSNLCFAGKKEKEIFVACDAKQHLACEVSRYSFAAGDCIRIQVFRSSFSCLPPFLMNNYKTV